MAVQRGQLQTVDRGLSLPWVKGSWAPQSEITKTYSSLVSLEAPWLCQHLDFTLSRFELFGKAFHFVVLSCLAPRN